MPAQHVEGAADAIAGDAAANWKDLGRQRVDVRADAVVLDQSSKPRLVVHGAAVPRQARCESKESMRAVSSMSDAPGALVGLQVRRADRPLASLTTSH